MAMETLKNVWLDKKETISLLLKGSDGKSI